MVKERCESGRIGLTANELTSNRGPGVQIPPSPLRSAAPVGAPAAPLVNPSRLTRAVGVITFHEAPAGIKGERPQLGRADLGDLPHICPTSAGQGGVILTRDE